MRSVTDGEMRRTSWHMDFLCEIGGVVNAGTQLRPFENETGAVRNEIAFPKITGELNLDHTIFGTLSTFLKSVTKVGTEAQHSSTQHPPRPRRHELLHGPGDSCSRI